METNYELVHNEAKHQYELHIEGHLAQIVKDAFADIEKRGLKIVPVCTYTIAYVEKHPQYKRLLP